MVGDAELGGQPFISSRRGPFPKIRSRQCRPSRLGCRNECHQHHVVALFLRHPSDGAELEPRPAVGARERTPTDVLRIDRIRDRDDRPVVFRELVSKGVRDVVGDSGEERGGTIRRSSSREVQAREPRPGVRLLAFEARLPRGDRLSRDATSREGRDREGRRLDQCQLRARSSEVADEGNESRARASFPESDRSGQAVVIDTWRGPPRTPCRTSARSTGSRLGAIPRREDTNHPNAMS